MISCLPGKLFFFILLTIVMTSQIVAIEKSVQNSIKERILEKQKEINAIEEAGRGELLKELAVLYAQDQNHEHSFETFISALATAQFKSVASDQGEEQYKEALDLYLHSRGDAQETAVEILHKYSHSMSPEGQPQTLGYLIALAYANLGKYVEFFEWFYPTYTSYPGNYLADKTQAILHIKLFERAGDIKKRESLRKPIISYLKRAEIKEPSDISIYKLQITFCSSEERAEIVSRCLNKIMESNIIIPRSEIQFYVQHAVDTRQKELAQRFIEKAREWHSTSRIIDTAQKFLDSSF